MSDDKLVCWNCGVSLNDIPRPISRHANCPGCFEVLHCCRLCRWYKPGRPGDCDHDRAEPPVEKENANFCDYFSPTTLVIKKAGADRHVAAKSHLDSLFGGASDTPADEPSDARSRLDDLFND